MKRSTFSPTRFYHSLRHALRGVGRLFASEPNARIHLLFAVAVPLLAWWLEVNPCEWLILLVCIGLVLAGEALNTALEHLCDQVCPEYSEHIRDAKDLAAAAVLLLATLSVIIGLIIFLPKLLSLLLS